MNNKEFNNFLKDYEKKHTIVHRTKLRAAILISCACLLGLGVGVGILINREINRASEIQKENDSVIIDSTCVINTEISKEFVKDSNGNKTGVIKSKTGYAITSVAVTKGDKVLKADEDYAASALTEEDLEEGISWRITIFNKALTENLGKVKIFAYYGGETEKEYTVTLNDQFEGDTTIREIKVKQGECIVFQGSKHHDNYGLINWYTDKECTKIFDFDTEITQNVTLYGKWIGVTETGLLYTPDNIISPTCYTVTMATDAEELTKLPKNVVIPTTYKNLPVVGIGSLNNVYDAGGFNSSQIDTISIPSTITSIQAYAFENSSVKSVSLPDSIKIIYNSAFKSCNSLVNINFNEGLEAIENEAFYNTLVRDVVLPSTLTFLGNSSFNNSSRLKNVDLSSCNKLKEIGCSSFSYCTRLKKISLPEQGVLETINSYAFCQSYYLETINIPSSVLNISSQAFNGCIGLTKVNFNEDSKLLFIGDWAFQSCDIRSFAIPKNVSSIGIGILSGNALLKKVEFINTENTWYVSGYSEYKKEDYNPNDPSEEKNPVELMNDYLAFERNGIADASNSFYFTTISDDECLVNGLINKDETNVIIPLNATLNNKEYSVVGINTGAFNDSNNKIENIEFEIDNDNENKNIQSIYNYAFSNCKNVKNIKNLDKCINLNKIGEYAFQYCGYNDPTIILDLRKTKLRICERNVFNGFISLKEVYFPESLEIIDSTAFGDSSVELVDFQDCTNLFQIDISEDHEIFEYCSNLKSIDLSNTKLTHLCYGCFQYCTSLTDVNLPETIRYFDYYMFNQATNLQNITIPTSCFYLNDRVFTDTYNLDKVLINSVYIDFLYENDESRLFDRVNYFYVPTGRELGSAIQEDFEKAVSSEVQNYDKWVKKS